MNTEKNIKLECLNLAKMKLFEIYSSVWIFDAAREAGVALWLLDVGAKFETFSPSFFN